MIDKRRHYVLVVDTETANTLTETVPAEIGEDGEIITPERVRMDSWYVHNWSIWLDIVMLWRTVSVVINGNGAC